jgi:hypothetical protein
MNSRNFPNNSLSPKLHCNVLIRAGSKPLNSPRADVEPIASASDIGNNILIRQQHSLRGYSSQVVQVRKPMTDGKRSWPDRKRRFPLYSFSILDNLRLETKNKIVVQLEKLHS